LGFDYKSLEERLRELVPFDDRYLPMSRDEEWEQEEQSREDKDDA
jgi:hypothetical protein